MAKSKTKYAKCSSCLTDKHKTEMTISLSVMDKITRKEINNYKELNIDIYSAFINSDFEWACDTCLTTKKAVLANTGLQTPSMNPHLAYFDKNLMCKSCGEEFLFTKEEKRFWFEVLKFWIDSEPVSCLKCRREIRVLKSENKILSEILKKELAQISIEELEKVIEVYRKWDKNDRVAFYEAQLKKRRKTATS
jgi:transcription elongation factor Elf1